MTYRMHHLVGGPRILLEVRRPPWRDGREAYKCYWCWEWLPGFSLPSKVLFSECLLRCSRG